MSDPYYSIAQEGLVHDSIDGEVIVLNVKTGTYYNLSGSAADIWLMLMVGSKISVISARLSEHYSNPPQLEEDVRKFVELMERESIVVQISSDAARGSSGPLESVSREWVPPSVATYEDLQDLLTIDPIHDVDDSGWPNAKAN